MSIIRWGIIGCGDVCERKSGPAFQKARNSELVAVMRRDAQKARDYATRHGVPRWYDNADDLINDPHVDAVYVATPPASHAQYTLKAAHAGKPVYVEKPMACSFEQCQKMIEECRRCATPLFVAYYRRGLPVFVKVKQLLENDSIGDIRLVQAMLWHAPRQGDRNPADHHWHVLPAISGGGYLFDVGSHVLDILDFFFGAVTHVEAICDNQAGWYEPEDICAAALKFETGVTGAVSFCFTINEVSRTDRIEIVGENGTITFSCFDNDPIQLTTPAGREQFAFDRPEHVQQPLVQSIVDELRGRGKCPSTGVSGARTSWVMDKMVGRG